MICSSSLCDSNLNALIAPNNAPSLLKCFALKYCTIRVIDLSLIVLPPAIKVHVLYPVFEAFET